MQKLACVRPDNAGPRIEAIRWVSSRDAVQLVMDAYSQDDPTDHWSDEMRHNSIKHSATEAILRRLIQGTLLARPADFQFVADGDAWEPTAIALDKPNDTIPKKFWATLKRCERFATLDWTAGDFSFDVGSDVPFGHEHGFANAVDFDRAGLPAIVIEPVGIGNSEQQVVVPTSRRGAPRKWDWDGALLHLAALAHYSGDALLRDDGDDPNQSDIARHLQDWFIGMKGDTPEPSQLRGYGRRFVAELNALKLQGADKSVAAA